MVMQRNELLSVNEKSSDTNMVIDPLDCDLSTLAVNVLEGLGRSEEGPYFTNKPRGLIAFACAYVASSEAFWRTRTLEELHNALVEDDPKLFAAFHAAERE